MLTDTGYRQVQLCKEGWSQGAIAPLYPRKHSFPLSLTTSMRHILEMEILRSRGHVTCLQSRCCHRGEAGLGPAGPSSQAPSLAYCEEETESKRRECQSPERSRRLLDPGLLITWQSVSSHAKGRVWTTLAATFSKVINSFQQVSFTWPSPWCVSWFERGGGS